MSNHISYPSDFARKTHYYIYSLTDPRYNTLFYVGCTSNIKQRLHDHMANTNPNVTEIKRLFFDELKDAGVRPTVGILDELATSTPMYAKQIERAWIRIMFLRHHQLINTSLAPDIENEEQAFEMIKQFKYLESRTINHPNSRIKIGY